MFRIVLAIIFVMCFNTAAWALSTPEYIEGPADVFHWPDYDIASAEVNFLNNHPLFGDIIRENTKNMEIYLVQDYKDGILGEVYDGDLYLYSDPLYALGTSLFAYTKDGDPIWQCLSSEYKLIEHEVIKQVIAKTWTSADKRSFRFVTNYHGGRIDTYLASYFTYLFGNPWANTYLPGRGLKNYDYRTYYAFWDCMVNHSNEVRYYNDVKYLK